MYKKGLFFLSCPSSKKNALMENKFEDNKQKNYALMRSVLDYGMGILIIGCGLFFLFSEKLGFQFEFEPLFRYIFAGMCLLYGGWRIYRGYQKNYFQE
jgi:hypothetical protein